MRIHKNVYEIFYSVLVKHYRDIELADYEPAKHWKLSRKIWKTLIPNERSLRSLRIAGSHSSDPEIFYRIRTEARASDGDSYTTKIAKDVLFISALNYLGLELPLELSESELAENVTAHILLQCFLEKHKPSFLDEYPELKVFDSVHAVINPFPKEKLPSNGKQKIENEPQKLLSTGKENGDVTTVLQTYFNHILSCSLNSAFQLLHPRLQEEWKNDSLNIYIGFVWTKSIKISVFDIQEIQGSITCKIYLEELINIKHALEFINLDFYKFLQIPTRSQKAEFERYRKLDADKKFIYQMVGDLRTRYTPYTPSMTYNKVSVFTVLYETLSCMKPPVIVSEEKDTIEKFRWLLECHLVRSGENVLISRIAKLSEIGS